MMNEDHQASNSKLPTGASNQASWLEAPVGTSMCSINKIFNVTLLENTLPYVINGFDQILFTILLWKTVLRSVK